MVEKIFGYALMAVTFAGLVFYCADECRHPAEIEIPRAPRKVIYVYADGPAEVVRP